MCALLITVLSGTLTRAANDLDLDSKVEVSTVGCEVTGLTEAELNKLISIQDARRAAPTRDPGQPIAISVKTKGPVVATMGPPGTDGLTALEVQKLETLRGESSRPSAPREAGR
jgi:hypothetical protein